MSRRDGGRGGEGEEDGMTEAMVSLFGEIGFVGHSVALWDGIGSAGRFFAHQGIDAEKAGTGYGNCGV